MKEKITSLWDKIPPNIRLIVEQIEQRLEKEPELNSTDKAFVCILIGARYLNRAHYYKKDQLKFIRTVMKLPFTENV